MCHYLYCVEGLRPVALYPLDESHSDGKQIYDISGNGLTGTLPGGLKFTHGPGGNPTGSAMFAGSSTDYLEIVRSDNLDTKKSVTIIATIFPTKFEVGPIVYYQKKDSEGNDKEGISLRLKDQGLQFRLVGRDQTPGLRETATVYDVITLNEWNVIVATYSYETGNASLYVNSTLVHSYKVGIRELETNGDIRIGAVTGDARYFFGRIACLRIFSSSLSTEVVAASEDCPIRKSSSLQLLSSLCCHATPQLKCF